MQRQDVHLSADRDVSVTVGARRQAQPVVLTVDAARAAGDGLWFAAPDGQPWLTEAVPATYLSR